MEETTTMTEEVQTTATEQGQQVEEVTQEKVNAFQKFLNGLFGAGKETDTEKKEETSQEDVKATPKEEKTFTQADMDVAIETAKKQWLEELAEAERVKKLSPEEKAKEEQEKKDSEIASLKNQLLQKELRETATKALEKDGFPIGLAEVLDYSSKERMEETLNHTIAVFKESLNVAIKTRLKGKTPGGLGGAASAENLIRDQIAKNIRGL